MQVTRIEDAPATDPPKHYDCRALRLQGFDVSPTTNFWVGMTHVLPAGGCERDATPLEKVYVVVNGELTIVTDEGETVLRQYDSCYLAPDEARAIENRTNLPASMIVVLPYPPGH